MGARNNPIWRVVATDQRSPRDGRFIEVLGPLQPADGSLHDRPRRGEDPGWIQKGAQPSRDRQAADEGKGDHRLKQLLEFLAKTLVDHPDQVRVDEFEEEDETVVYELIVAEEDRGKVIGRSGRTAKALRAIMKAGGTKEGKRVLVEIVD